MIWWERLCEKKESANRQAVQGKLNLESQSALAKKKHRWKTGAR